MGMPLPIELSDFSAEPRSYGTLVKWTTHSELNNDFFLVERSYDAAEWQELAQVDGAGTSSVATEYSVIDQREQETVYYRLTQVDFDGGSKTFPPVVVSSGAVNASAAPYPNPVDRVLNVPGLTESEEMVLLNGAGLKIDKSQYERKGNEIFLGNLADGIYLLQLNGETGADSHKILVKH